MPNTSQHFPLLYSVYPIFAYDSIVIQAKGGCFSTGKKMEGLFNSAEFWKTNLVK